MKIRNVKNLLALNESNFKNIEIKVADNLGIWFMRRLWTAERSWHNVSVSSKWSGSLSEYAFSIDIEVNSVSIKYFLRYIIHGLFYFDSVVMLRKFRKISFE